MGLFLVEQTPAITNLRSVFPKHCSSQAFVLSGESESPPMAAVPQITRFFLAQSLHCSDAPWNKFQSQLNCLLLLRSQNMENFYSLIRTLRTLLIFLLFSFNSMGLIKGEIFCIFSFLKLHISQ